MKNILENFLLLLILVSSQTVFADFKAGGAAYMQGDYSTAAKEFLESADKGDHRAMLALGSMYSGGQGVGQDYKQAYTWFRKAAKYGRPDANYKLGLMYEQGLGLQQDFKKALRYYGKAARAGYPLAQYKLGAYYSEGLGVEVDNVKALAWLMVADNKLGAALDTPAASEEASEEFLEQQDAFKQQSTGLKLSDLKNRIEKLTRELSAEEKETAKLLALKYSQY